MKPRLNAWQRLSDVVIHHDLYEKVVKEVGIIAPVEFVPKGISINARESENAEYLLLNL